MEEATTLLDETSQLLIDIARCPNVHKCITKQTDAHPCSRIVRTQQSKSLMDHQMPEPWSGHLTEARVLFVSSNPSIDETSYYPEWKWPDNKIVPYFNNRFEESIKEGIYYLKTDKTWLPQQYWTEIRNRANELYDRPTVPGQDYALTEVVHCKSKANKGVDKALQTCADLYLSRLLSLSPAPILVIVGRWAKAGMIRKYQLSESPPVCGPINIGGQDRFVVFLPAPGSPYPRTFTAEPFLPFLPTLRKELSQIDANTVCPESS